MTKKEQLKAAQHALEELSLGNIQDALDAAHKAKTHAALVSAIETLAGAAREYADEADAINDGLQEEEE